MRCDGEQRQGDGMTCMRVGFNGEIPDRISGQYNLGSGCRAFHPVLMRFACPDSWSPFGAAGLNPWAYCLGDPINRADPSGHISGAGIAGIAAGVLGLLLVPFTAGQSLTVASCAIAGLEIVSGATAIAAGALETTRPQTSATLGWVSLATGMVSSLTGTVVAGARKLEGLAAKLSRINGRIGLPLSGEFRHARFLGVNRSEGRVYWNIRFEDTVPAGRRLTVMMGAVWENGTLRAVNETPYAGHWFTQFYTPAALRNAIQQEGDTYDVYRLAIPASTVTQPGGSGSLVNRFRTLLAADTPVIGYRESPSTRGIVADALAHQYNIVSHIEQHGGIWLPEEAERGVADLSARYGMTAGAITFDTEGIIYPLSRRRAWQQLV